MNHAPSLIAMLSGYPDCASSQRTLIDEAIPVIRQVTPRGDNRRIDMGRDDGHTRRRMHELSAHRLNHCEERDAR